MSEPNPPHGGKAPRPQRNEGAPRGGPARRTQENARNPCLRVSWGPVGPPGDLLDVAGSLYTSVSPVIAHTRSTIRQLPPARKTTKLPRELPILAARKRRSPRGAHLMRAPGGPEPREVPDERPPRHAGSGGPLRGQRTAPAGAGLSPVVAGPGAPREEPRSPGAQEPRGPGPRGAQDDIIV